MCLKVMKGFPTGLDAMADDPENNIQDESHSTEILIVSDDVSIHGPILDELKRLFLGVSVVRGGHGLPKQLQQHKPDLILLDYRLTETDSIALCVDMKDSGYTRDIAVIFMLEADDFDKRRLVFNAGAHDVLIKPLILEELLLRVNAYTKPRFTQTPVFDASGRGGHVFGMAREISKRIEQQISLMSFTLNQLLDAVFLIDTQPDSCFSYVNDKACLSLGYSREELLNMRIVDIDPVVNVQDILSNFAQVEQQGFIRIESYHSKKNGEIFPVEVSCSQFIHDQQRVIICVVRDITERKIQQEKLQRSEREYRTLAENIPDPIFRYAPDGRRLFVNQAMERLSGLSVQSLLNYTPLEVPVLARSEAEKLLAKIQQVVETREPAENEVNFICPNGSELIFYNRYIPEFGGNGEIVSVLLISHDVTEQKRSEKERQYHLHDYECMDRVNRAMQGSTDFESMMNDVLDVVLEIFDCDRAYLIYPCDPEADFWQVPIERTRPEYPGALSLGLIIPMDEGMKITFRHLFNAEGVVTFGTGNQYPLPETISVQFGFKAMMSMILYPKVENSWNFGIHQCSAMRIWTPYEIKLFQKISLRLNDGLNSLLAYRALQKSEALYRSLVATMIEGLIVQSPAGEVISLNPAAEKILGLSADKLLGKRLEDFLPAVITHDGKQFSVDQLPSRVSICTGQPQFDVEMGFCRANDETVWISVNSQPLIEEVSLLPYAAISTFHDITERKRAEAEKLKLIGIMAENENLLKSRLKLEQRLSRMANYIPGFLYTFKLDVNGHGCFPYVSAGIMDMYGLSPEMVAQDMAPLHIMAHAEDRPGLEAAIEKSVQSITLFHQEFRVCHPTKGIVWVEAKSAPVREPDGSVLFYGFMQDITERKQMEAIIWARESEFRALADNLPDVIVRYDRSCRRIYANRVYYHLHGMVNHDCLDKTPLEFWRCIRPDAEVFVQMLQRVMATGIQESLLLEIVDKKNKTMYFSMNLVPEWDSNGLLTGVLSCATDITEIKEYERQVSDSHIQLRALTLRSEKMREEERKRIARELHDDLGQRLTALRLEISCLTIRYGQNNPALEKQGQDIEKSIATTIQIVRNVVMSMRPTTLEMGIIAALKWLVKEFRKNTGIPCRLQLFRRKMQLDDGQAIALFRIAQESLTNIMRHAKASHVEIELSTDGKNYVMVISDNGIGFDAKTKPKVGSFGIIGIKERAFILGGHVYFDTAPGKGVKLTVILPVSSSIHEA